MLAETLPAQARKYSRGGRDFWVITETELIAWGQTQNLDLRQSFRLALRAGVFPECLERNFPGLNAAEQLSLWESSVLVAGLGGLGGVQAMLLARVGVGRLLLADGDVFSLSNLNRQILATHKTLGLNKAMVTSQCIEDINPAILTEAVTDFLTPDNLPSYLSQVQVVVDGLDSMPARLHLFNAARQAGRPLIHGAVAESFGQVSTILPDEPIPFEKLYPTSHRKSAAAVPGVLATTVTLVASLQVQEAVRLLLGGPPAYSGRLVHFDGETGQLESLTL